MNASIGIKSSYAADCHEINQSQMQKITALEPFPPVTSSKRKVKGKVIKPRENQPKMVQKNTN